MGIFQGITETIDPISGAVGSLSGLADNIKSFFGGSSSAEKPSVHERSF